MVSHHASLTGLASAEEPIWHSHMLQGALRMWYSLGGWMTRSCIAWILMSLNLGRSSAHPAAQAGSGLLWGWPGQLPVQRQADMGLNSKACPPSDGPSGLPCFVGPMSGCLLWQLQGWSQQQRLPLSDVCSGRGSQVWLLPVPDTALSLLCSSVDQC